MIDAMRARTHNGTWSFQRGRKLLARGDAHSFVSIVEGMHDSPVSFLFYHAIELYLKAFLRHHGHTPSELASKFGHKTDRLSERAAALR
jgi:hypothetical protein